MLFSVGNSLYLAVLPLVHLSPNQFFGYGLTEQTLTLFPDKNFATEFFEDEVDGYIAVFEKRIPLLTGGHVTGYEFFKEPTSGGRVIVRVVQNVK
jgi:hypothetical protein